MFRQLPICLGATIVCWAAFASVAASKAAEPVDPDLIPRSEERRVGKEC